MHVAGFDLERPLVASSRFTAGDKVIDAGGVFDWRAHGMTEVEVFALYRAGLLVPAVAVVATPGERVLVETPAQAKRRDRR